MAISTTGSFLTPGGTGFSTATITIANAGDFVVILLAIANGTNITPSSLTGTNGVGALNSTATVYDAQTGAGACLFYGKCPTAGTSVLTPTYSAAPGTNGTQYDGWMFTAGLGASTLWSVDTQGTRISTTTTVLFPSLSAASTGELYAGAAVVQAAGSAGATAGFTYDVDSAWTNIYVRNANASGTLAPTGTQTGGGTNAISAAILVTATLPSSSRFISQYNTYH